MTVRFSAGDLRPASDDATLNSSLATLAIHAGPGPDPTTGAILPPICQSTTFVQAGVGRHKGYTYTRTGNPTVAALEQALGALEGAPPAVCTSTGMSALTLLCLALLKAGDRVVLSEIVYGGTVRLLRDILSNFGVAATFVDTADLVAVKRALSERTRLVLVESPANPTLRLTDLRAVSELARAAGALLAVDNTFLTAALQEPLECGADISVYSTTKFIEGHNSTLGGALVSRDTDLLERLRLLQGALGVAQSPFDAWQTLRGLKTLPLRIREHTRSAQRVARFLEEHRAVAAVYYPGLESFAQYALAREQQREAGGVIAFDLRGGGDVAVRVLESLQLCSLAENLGSVESLVTHPATMTHSQIPAPERARLGIGDGLVRLSVGLEDPVDIIADLDRALNAGGA